MPPKASSWRRSKAPPPPPLTPVPPASEVTPRWLQAVVLACALVVLLANFSYSFADTDSWWHLKTGQYIVQQHRLPVPDPFAFTTEMGTPVYPAEPMIRHLAIRNS